MTTATPGTGHSAMGHLDPMAGYHQTIAAYLCGWADDLSEESAGRTAPADERDFILGYQRALRDLAAHLRDGDVMPDGPLFIDMARAAG